MLIRIRKDSRLPSRHGRVIVALLGAALAACGGVTDTTWRDPAGGTAGKAAATGGSVARAGAGATSVGGDGGSDSGGTTAGEPMGGSGGRDEGGRGGSGGGGGSSGGGHGGAECFDACDRYGDACCGPGLSCIAPGGACKLEVLREHVEPGGDYAAFEQRVAALPQDVLGSLTDADIDWAAAEPAPASRLELHTAAQASGGATELEEARERPFRVSCGGKSLFVGVVYEEIGAAALKVPVLHIAPDADGSLRLRIGAWQGAWILPATGLGSVEQRERIDRPELRAVFCRRGVLSEL